MKNRNKTIHIFWFVFESVEKYVGSAQKVSTACGSGWFNVASHNCSKNFERGLGGFEQIRKSETRREKYIGISIRSFPLDPRDPRSKYLTFQPPATADGATCFICDAFVIRYTGKPLEPDYGRQRGDRPFNGIS
jgi:hypothetical protein